MVTCDPWPGSHQCPAKFVLKQPILSSPVVSSTTHQPPLSCVRAINTWSLKVFRSCSLEIVSPYQKLYPWATCPLPHEPLTYAHLSQTSCFPFMTAECPHTESDGSPLTQLQLCCPLQVRHHVKSTVRRHSEAIGVGDVWRQFSFKEATAVPVRPRCSLTPPNQRIVSHHMAVTKGS